MTPFFRQSMLVAVWLVVPSSPAFGQMPPWPSTPLFIGLNVPPNLVLSVDDSSSMDFEVLLPTNDGALWWNTADQSFVGRDQNDQAAPGVPNYNRAGNANSTWQKYVYLFPNGTGTGNRIVADASDDHFAIPPLPQYAFLRSSAYNKAYYDPSVTYTPWPSSYGVTFSNASSSAAVSDPARGGATINLTANLLSTASNWLFRVQPGMRYVNGTAVATYSTEASVSMSYYPATYYMPTTPAPAASYNSGRSNCQAPKPQDYKDFEQNPAMVLPAGVNAIGPDGRCLTLYEIKPGNSFPSGRSYANEIQNFANWFVYYRKRHLATRGAILRAFEDVRGIYLATFAFNNRTSPLPFYEYPGSLSSGVPVGKDTLYKAVKDYVNAAGTPTRESLNHIGSQLARTSDSPLRHTCQRNFGIVFTDGFATNTTVGVGNEDRSSGPPYADDFSETLGDIAMRYYRRLRSGGDVPAANGCGLAGAPAWLDCNTEWHLNTYAVTLGARGTIFGVSHFKKEDAYLNPPVWPNPNIQRHPFMIDDLYHATINGRGEMLNADDTNNIQAKLRQIIDTIIAINGSGSGVAVNVFKLNAASRVFYATFESGTWSGDLLAYPITASGVEGALSWKTSSNVPAPSSRRIFTVSGGNGVEFVWSSLSVSDRTLLKSQDIVNYLRGDRSKEIQNGGALRNRPVSNVLGDIAHFSPVYLKENNTIFVGANDGMLHAYDANTGRERFAFIPSILLSRVASLSDPNYQHQYFVDGQASVTSRLDTAGRNVLVATLGRGGKGLFALDVTDPDGATAGNIVKWEQYGSGDADMGHILGQPVIAKVRSEDYTDTNKKSEMVVIVGNGYASASGRAVLYILRLSDGALIKKLDTEVGSSNGMGPPSVHDEDGDGIVDYVYSGDLRGNLWRIDVKSKNRTQWKFRDGSGSKPVAYFVAKDSSGNIQPITAPVVAATNPADGQRMLLFGTGSYIFSGDASDRSVQSWYGLFDVDSPIGGRGDLRQRTVESQGFFDGKPVRTFGQASPGDMAGRKGWYLDFTGGVGERIVTQTLINQSVYGSVAIASSIIPSPNPCEAGGRGYVNFIDPFTGGGLTYGVVDINDNKNFNDDKLGDKFIGSVDVGVGMPNKPELTDSRVVIPGTKGIGSLPVRLAKPAVGRLNWREVIRN